MKKISKKFLCVVIILAIIGGFLYLCNDSRDTSVYLSEFEDIDDVSINQDDETDIIAYLTIDSIGLEKVPVAEGTGMEVLNEYVGHFEETPYINGNVVLCAHNRGYEKNYFENLKNINNGDIIKYQTKNQEYKYKVSEVKKILETDLSVLEQDKKSKITLITCVENIPQYRYCVTAEKIK